MLIRVDPKFYRPTEVVSTWPVVLFVVAVCLVVCLLFFLFDPTIILHAQELCIETRIRIEVETASVA